MQGSLYLSYAVMTLAFAAGGGLLKVYIHNEHVMVLMAAFACYFFGNGFLILLLKTQPLAVAMTASSCAQIVLMTILGYVLGDRITLLQLAGVGTAMTSLWLVVPRTGEL